ncbi:MAG: GNAT family N-acetyltransferase [Treponema sp.]|jgi:predicted GNAT family acetyltransferase|nr:GNAT family N-acetyltransferase [Treponema sp.]
MNYNLNVKWRKIKNNEKDTSLVKKKLQELENNYVCACVRFLSSDPLKDPVWILSSKNKTPNALIINSKSTIIPVFDGIKTIPKPKFLKKFSALKKIHSIQGLKEEVIVMEGVMEEFGKGVSETFDYNLMSIEAAVKTADANRSLAACKNLILRAVGLSDLDALAPLQAAYEHEEVLHRGSVFSPAASRINLAKIITGGKILAAELDGRLVGKINVSGESFSRYLIGGVYVHHDFRGQGIARIMTERFIASLFGEGKGITLFVKKANLAANRLYAGLGFKVLENYRITYLSD